MKSGKCQYMTGSRYRVSFPNIFAQLLLITYRKCGKYGKFIRIKLQSTILVKNPIPVFQCNLPA